MGYEAQQETKAREGSKARLVAPSSRLGMFVDFEQLRAAILFELGERER
jgi:hypothetical protein